MKGDTKETKYFGTYVEAKDTDWECNEYVGTVRVEERITKYQRATRAYLSIDNKMYDVPIFMEKYAGKKVAVLARETTTKVNNKVFLKLVVIAVLIIEETNTGGEPIEK